MPNKNSTRYKSNLQEKDVAKTLGGKTTIASGSFWGMKADVRSDDYLIECKTTSKNFYSVTAKVWEKIEKEAIRDRGRTPLLIVDLLDGKKRYVIFRPQDFGIVTDGLLSINDIPKSVRIKEDTLGFTSFGDYCNILISYIKEYKISKIAVMLIEDFEEVLKNWH